MRNIPVDLIRGFLLITGILFVLNSCRIIQPREDYERIVDFSGYSWKVKTSNEPVGPGPNYFSGEEDQVWVDSTGALHLSVRNNGGSWYCSEVISMNRFSYGTYSFELGPQIDKLDPGAVLGLFTWNPAPGNHNREIDIEFTRLGNPGLLNAQYVVQPYHLPFHHHRFSFKQTGDISTHRFTWGLNSIVFTSFDGPFNDKNLPAQLQNWSFSGPSMKHPGRAQVRINLWLFNGQPPLNKTDIEVVIRNFTFTPFSLMRPVAY